MFLEKEVADIGLSKFPLKIQKLVFQTYPEYLKNVFAQTFLIAAVAQLITVLVLLTSLLCNAVLSIFLRLFLCIWSCHMLRIHPFLF